MKIDQNNGPANPARLPIKPRSPALRPATEPDGGCTAAIGNVRPFPQLNDGFDAAKVNAIREQIRSGQYRVDPERIADGLLASVRELLSGRVKE